MNNELVKVNWEIGQYIVEYEQNEKEKADYGSALLTNLAKDLKSEIKLQKDCQRSLVLSAALIPYAINRNGL